MLENEYIPRRNFFINGAQTAKSDISNYSDRLPTQLDKFVQQFPHILGKVPSNLAGSAFLCPASFASVFRTTEASKSLKTVCL